MKFTEADFAPKVTPKAPLTFTEDDFTVPKAPKVMFTEDDFVPKKSSALGVFGRSFAQTSPVGVGKAIATGKPLFTAEDFAEEAQHPVANFFGRALGGTATFGLGTLVSLIPGVGLPVAFGAAGALSQAGTQAERIAREPEYQPNAAQLAGQQAVSGAGGALMGKVFGTGVKVPFIKARFGGNVAPTLARRVGQVAGASGAIATGETLAQQKIEGKWDPEQALLNGAMTAVSIGILKTIVEYPQLRSLVVKDARNLSGNQKLDYRQAKSFFRNKTTINPEELSPQLQTAMKEVKVAAAIKDVNYLAKKYGVPDSIVKSVLRERNVRSRIGIFDSWITKTDPVTQAKLAPFRKAIGQGADPSDVLLFLEVRDKLVPASQTEYVSPQSKLAVSKMRLRTEGGAGVVETRGMAEVSGGKGTDIVPIVKPKTLSLQLGETVLERSLSKLRENNPALPVPSKLNAGFKNSILADIASKSDKMTEDQLAEDLTQRLSTAQPGEVWLESMHKADDPNANIWDVASLQPTSIKEFAIRYRNIDPESIVVRRNLVFNQKPGVADTVRNTILEEIKSEKRKYPPPPEVKPVEQAPEPTPVDTETPNLQPIIQEQIDKLSTPTEEKVEGERKVLEPTLQAYFKTKKKEEIGLSDIEAVRAMDTEIDRADLRDWQGKEARRRIKELRKRGVKVSQAVIVRIANEIKKLPEPSATERRAQSVPEQQEKEVLGIDIPETDVLSRLLWGEEEKRRKVIEQQQAEEIERIRLEKIAVEHRAQNKPKSMLSKYFAKHAPMVVEKKIPFKKKVEQEDEERAKQRYVEEQEEERSLVEQEVGIPGTDPYIEEKQTLIDSINKKLVVLRDKLDRLIVQKAPDVRTKAVKQQISEIEEFLKKESKNLRDAPIVGITDAESTGGFTFKNIENVVFETDKGNISLRPGTYDLYQSEDKKEYYLPVGDDVYTLSPRELTKLYNNPTISFDAMHFYKPTETDHEKWIHDRTSPLTNEEGGFRTVSKQGIQLPPEYPEKIKTFNILSILRRLPWADNIIDYLLNKEQIAAMGRKFEPYAPGDDIKGILFRGAKYMDATKELAWMQLRPSWDYFVKSVQQMQELRGEKGKAAEQDAFKMYAQLSASASAQIKMDAYGVIHDFTFHAKGRHPVGFRNPGDAVEAYVQRVKMFYDYFKIPLNDQIPEGNKDTPEGFSNTPGTLRYGRSPVFWDLLTHQNVMTNDSLEIITKIFKANIEAPYLEEEMNYGIFSTADIYANRENGYQRRAFSLLPGTPQAEAEKTGFKDVLSTDNQPKAEFSTYEEFVYMAKNEGWRAVDDIFLNTYDYIVNALRAIKQAQMLGELLIIPKPGPLEYTSKEWNAILKEHPSPYVWHSVEHTTSDTIAKETQRISKLLGYKVEATAVLTEAGYIQGKAFEGLAKKHGGVFNPPWVYASVHDLFMTFFREKPSFQNLAKIAQATNIIRFWQCVNPADTIGSFLASSTVVKNPFQIVPKIISIYGWKLPKAVLKAAKIAPMLAKGQSLPLPGRAHPEQYALLHKFIEAGLVAGTGWSNVVRNMIDKETAVLPETQGRFDNFKDVFFGVGGLNTAVFDYMIADEIFEATKILYEQFRDKGMPEEDAIHRAVDSMNQSSYLINRISVGKENLLWRLAAYSRNFALAPLRDISVIIRALPEWKLGRIPLTLTAKKKRQIFRFRTGPFGELANPLLAAEMTEIDGAIMGAHILRIIASLMFMHMLIDGLRQYVDSFRDDGILDEFGETGYNADGSIDYGAKKRFMLNNPGPRKFTRRLPLQFKDIHGKPQYVDSQWFRRCRDVVDIMSSVFDPIMRAASGNPYIQTGRGMGAWMKGKSGVLQSLLNIVSNKDDQGNQIVNWNNFTDWDSAMKETEKVWKLFYTKFVVPIGFVGIMPGTEGSPGAPIRTNDPVANAQLNLMDLTGENIKKGWVFDDTITSEQTRRELMDAARQRSNEQMIPGIRYSLTEQALQALTPEEKQEYFRAKTSERDWRLQRERPGWSLHKQNKKLLERFNKGR